MTRDANRIWQVAPRLDERQFRDRQRVPPSSADQAQLKKLSIVDHVSRTLRAFDADKGEKGMGATGSSEIDYCLLMTTICDP